MTFPFYDFFEKTLPFFEYFLYFFTIFGLITFILLLIWILKRMWDGQE
jgi:flagellar biogenesis protein FliO